MCVPEGLLPHVVWWCWCVGGVLTGALPPLWLGVLVMWCVNVNVWVFLRGCCPIVVWWCWCVGGVLPGGVAPLWFGGGSLCVWGGVAHCWS